MNSILTDLKPKAVEHGLNELGLVQYLMQQLPETEVVGPRWFSYNKHTGCWEDHVKDNYRRLALSIISPAHRRVQLAHRVLDHLQDAIRTNSDFSGAIRGEDFSTVLVNTRNNVLRVTDADIKVLDHDSAFRFTRSLEVDYVPGAVNQLFEDVRPLILPEPEDRELFQLLKGNVFIPDARYEVFSVLYGEAGAGKDTITAPITALFGKPERGLITTFSINQISDPKSYALPQLQFAALNVCSELNSREVEDSSVFKMLVSGLPISTRMIYENPYAMTTACKLFYLTNNMPGFRFGTAAEGRRMRGLRTTYKPTKVDVTIKQRLLEPHPGTLNWMLEGLQKLLRMGNQPMPLGGPASREMHDRFTTANDPINDFLTRYCEVHPTYEVPKKDVVAVFNAYASDNDLTKGLRDNFFKMLYNRFPNIGTKRGRASDTRVQLLTGLKLNPEGAEIAEGCPNDIIIGQG